MLKVIISFFVYFRQQFEKSEWKMGRKATPSTTLTKAQYDSMQQDSTSPSTSTEVHYDNLQFDGNMSEMPTQSVSPLGFGNQTHPSRGRVHPYQRKQSTVLLHAQSNNTLPSHWPAATQAYSSNYLPSRNFNSLSRSDTSYQSYDGHNNSLNQSRSRGQNSSWHESDQSQERNSSADSNANRETPQRPTFQRIKLSSKFLK